MLQIFLGILMGTFLVNGIFKIINLWRIKHQREIFEYFSVRDLGDWLGLIVVLLATILYNEVTHNILLAIGEAYLTELSIAIENQYLFYHANKKK